MPKRLIEVERFLFSIEECAKSSVEKIESSKKRTQLRLLQQHRQDMCAILDTLASFYHFSRSYLVVCPPRLGLTSLLLQNDMQMSRHEMSRMIVIAAKQMVHVAKIVNSNLYYDISRQLRCCNR
jgi:hypothetical protein